MPAIDLYSTIHIDRVPGYDVYGFTILQGSYSSGGCTHYATVDEHGEIEWHELPDRDPGTLGRPPYAFLLSGALLSNVRDALRQMDEEDGAPTTKALTLVEHVVGNAVKNSGSLRHLVDA